ncbi:MAG: type II toxin-antitoxin system RelB family antitoxin [Gammaproteobacteria bacterium]
MLAIRLTPDIEKRLDALAKKTGRSKTYYAREAIQEYLEDLEDYYLAEVTMGKLRKGEMRTHTLKEVKQELGLED